MKKYLRLEGEMNNEMMEELITFANMLDETDEAHIFLTSHGGYTTIPQQMAFIINENENIKTISFSWQVTSSAFDLMLKIRPSKRIINTSVYCGLHLLSRDLDTNDALNLKENQKSRTLMEDMTDMNNQFLILLPRIGVTPHEIKIIKKGELIYMDYYRVIKALELYDNGIDGWKNELPRL